MNTKQERDLLKKANPSKKWAEQVDNMRPEKVTAVCNEYVKKLRQRKLKK